MTGSRMHNIGQPAAVTSNHSPTDDPQQRQGGALIINADDWGRDSLNTDRIADCCRVGAVTSTSAMMFMADSERAADISRELGIDTGLHLNLTTMFPGPANSKLLEYQRKVGRYLRGHRLAPVIFHPGLMNCFQYLVAAQLDEFRRLYECEPARIDGHHHMHLCSNVLLGGLLPEGTIVRRSFSFFPGEKSLANRTWRNIVNSLLGRRHRMTDFFFSLPPLNPNRLQTICSFASRAVVEVETHPVNHEEYAFLTSGAISQWSETIKVSSFTRLLN